MIQLFLMEPAIFNPDPAGRQHERMEIEVNEEAPVIPIDQAELPPVQPNGEENNDRSTREITFAETAVQTESPQWAVDISADYQQDAGTTRNGDRCSWPRWCCIDCTSCFYLIIASMMIGVGVAVVIVTNAKEQERQSKQDNITTAQLWIIGPIFITSGILVCIKLSSHVYRRIRGRRGGNTLNLPPGTIRTLSILPPSYSRALQARIPSNVIVEEAEYKQSDAQVIASTDSDSLRLVTITCDPPPPTYNEALQILENLNTTGRRNNVCDVATQSTSDGSIIRTV